MMKSVFLFSVGFLALICSCHEVKKDELCLNEQKLYEVNPECPVLVLDSMVDIQHVYDYLELTLSTSKGCPDNSRTITQEFNIKHQESTYKCKFIKHFGVYCGVSDNTQALINIYDDIYLEDERVPLDSLEKLVLNYRQSREGFSALYYEEFEITWFEGATTETVSKVFSEMYSAMKTAYDEKSMVLFSKPICMLDSAEFLELRPDNFCFVFEKPPPFEVIDFCLDSIDLKNIKPN